MSFLLEYNRADCTLIVKGNDNSVMREIACRDDVDMLVKAEIMRDFYNFGYKECLAEIERANEILNQYNISGIKIRKDD